MKALITGITGQDGSYLAEFLLAKGYEVHGVIRRSSSFNTGRIDHIFKDLQLHYGDLADPAITSLITKLAPDEIYNLAAQSHVKVSFEIPEYTCAIAGLGTLRVLEAARATGAKYYQAGSSEMFGNSPGPQSETTPFAPRSPYGCAKVMGHHLTVNYREAYGVQASNGILFNHESPRRGETFVTRKIAKAAARKERVVLGNCNAMRDWGYAPEYVEAMWLMQQSPGDYVVATGETNSVWKFAEAAYGVMGLEADDFLSWDEKYERPAEVEYLCGDASKIAELGWKPRTKFKDLVRIMVEAECECL